MCGTQGISIVVPVYNVPEAYLRHCIESLINQTFENIEIILVDDGSKDHSPAICDQYAEKDSRIIVIHKKNEGLSAARNTGYKHARKKWLMFVDGDDWVEPNMCEKMVFAAEKYEVQLVMCGMYKDYGHTAQRYTYYIKPWIKYEGSDCRWLQEQLLHFNGNIATAYCKLIDRSLLVKNHILHNEMLRQGAEGLEFNLRLFEYFESALFIDEYLYHYIYNENSISVKHDEANHAYVISCFERIKILVEQSENRETLKRWFDNRLLYVVITTAISGYFSPYNKECFTIKTQKYNKYLEYDIVQKALKSENTQGLSTLRKFALFCIKHKLFVVLQILGQIRAWQKEYR